MLNVSLVSKLGFTLLIAMEFSECDQKIHIRKQENLIVHCPRRDSRFVTLAIVITSGVMVA
jgi:hypothetical protein